MDQRGERPFLPLCMYLSLHYGNSDLPMFDAFEKVEQENSHSMHRTEWKDFPESPVFLFLSKQIKFHKDD